MSRLLATCKYKGFISGLAQTVSIIRPGCVICGLEKYQRKISAESSTQLMAHTSFFLFLFKFLLISKQVNNRDGENITAMLLGHIQIVSYAILSASYCMLGPATPPPSAECHVSCRLPHPVGGGAAKTTPLLTPQSHSCHFFLPSILVH